METGELCLRAQNYPMCDHIHVCDGAVGHPAQHRCYWCNEKWWQSQFDQGQR